MPFISSKGRNDKELSRRTIILILGGFIAAFLFAIFFQNNRDEKLKHSKITKAKIVKVYTPHGASISFNLKDEIIHTELLHGDYSMLKAGDTILIKYAIQDPELVELFDKRLRGNVTN